MRRTRYSAAREIVEKSPETINRESAMKWRQLSIESYKEYAKTAHENSIIKAEQFRDEALEHAALSGDFGRLVGKIERDLNAARRDARRKAGEVRRKAARSATDAMRQMPLREARALYRQITALDTAATRRAAHGRAPTHEVRVH